MKNFLITKKHNYFPITIPYEYIQEQKELKINKIIFYPKIEVKTVKFVLLIRYPSPVNSNILMHTFSVDLLYENNDIKVKDYAGGGLESDIDNDITLNYASNFIDGIFDINTIILTSTDPTKKRNIERNTYFNLKLYVNDQHMQSITDYTNLNVSILKLSFIPCKFIKIYITNISSTTMEINDNNEQKYTNLLTIKIPTTLPIELNDEDFTYTTPVSYNSQFYITDEDNLPIKLDLIYLFYSLY